MFVVCRWLLNCSKPVIPCHSKCSGTTTTYGSREQTCRQKRASITLSVTPQWIKQVNCAARPGIAGYLSMAHLPSRNLFLNVVNAGDVMYLQGHVWKWNICICQCVWGVCVCDCEGIKQHDFIRCLLACMYMCICLLMSLSAWHFTELCFYHYLSGELRGGVVLRLVFLVCPRVSMEQMLNVTTVQLGPAMQPGVQ